jgi:hypothetical protein
MKIYNDPQHWRDRADEARATAAQIVDPETRTTMLRIAEDYERLARLGEQRLTRCAVGQAS